MADQKDEDEDIAEELAFERLSAAGADADVASNFLKAKTEVLRKQLHQLHLSHFREWLYTSAEIVLGLVILLIFVGIASAVWSAAHDNGLVIESFSVPGTGRVLVHGEYWEADGPPGLAPGEVVRIAGVDGLRVRVERRN